MTLCVHVGGKEKSVELGTYNVLWPRPPRVTYHSTLFHWWELNCIAPCSYAGAGICSPQQGLTTILLLWRKGGPNLSEQLSGSFPGPTSKSAFENFAFPLNSWHIVQCFNEWVAIIKIDRIYNLLSSNDVLKHNWKRYLLTLSERPWGRLCYYLHFIGQDTEPEGG